MPNDTFPDSLPEKGVADRAYTRTLESFPIKFMPISKEDFESSKQLYLTKSTQDRMGEGVDVVAVTEETVSSVSADSPILAILGRIEQKLDKLLEASGLSEEKPKEHKFKIGNCLDLSGSGIRFSSRWPIEKEWYLRILINTAEPHPATIVVLGEVVRAEAVSDFSGYIVACKFASIHEEDRETIIAYTVKRQKELARILSKNVIEGEQ